MCSWEESMTYGGWLKMTYNYNSNGNPNKNSNANDNSNHCSLILVVKEFEPHSLCVMTW